MINILCRLNWEANDQNLTALEFHDLIHALQPEKHLRDMKYPENIF